jgi:glucose/arabinose dehydrogenase
VLPLQAAGAAEPSLKLTRVDDTEGVVTLTARPRSRTLYFAEQRGVVWALRGKTRSAQPVIDLSDRVSQDGGERGLLGLTFSPDGTQLFVHYSDTEGNTQVDRYTMRGGRADPSTRASILQVEQPQPNHNGGELVFGPDGHLYLGLGDGGGFGDAGAGHAPGGNGQSLGTLLGKILRIDPTPSAGKAYTVPPDNPFVSTAGARPEIWAYGLRNPWRFSFDTATGDLWIGDVGQNAYEEIDVAPRASGGGKGVNYGWNVREALHGYRDGNAPGAVDPVYELSHDSGNCSITGGYVYRGTKIPALRGGYLFADYCGGQLRAITVENGKVAQERELPARAQTITSFGQDAAGELYVLSDGGGVYRVDPA